MSALGPDELQAILAEPGSTPDPLAAYPHSLEVLSSTIKNISSNLVHLASHSEHQSACNPLVPLIAQIDKAITEKIHQSLGEDAIAYMERQCITFGKLEFPHGQLGRFSIHRTTIATMGGISSR